MKRFGWGIFAGLGLALCGSCDRSGDPSGAKKPSTKPRPVAAAASKRSEKGAKLALQKSNTHVAATSEFSPSPLRWGVADGRERGAVGLRDAFGGSLRLEMGRAIVLHDAALRFVQQNCASQKKGVDAASRKGCEEQVVDPLSKTDLRSATGSKFSLDYERLAAGKELEYRPKQPGFLSIHSCRRPASLDSRSNAWQLASYCEILHVGVLGPQGEVSFFGESQLSEKIGLPVELRPYSSTARLRPGEELSVRLYHRGIPVPGRRISAISPGGQVLEAMSNHRGVAELKIDAWGRWSVEASVVDRDLPQGEAKVRLVFDVLAPNALASSGPGYGAQARGGETQDSLMEVQR